MTLSLW